jgi:hypothetical protein
MKKKTNKNLIVRSIPVIGIWNEVINNCEIIPELELYSIDIDLLNSEDPAHKDALLFLLSNVVFSRVKRLSHLTDKLVIDDFRKHDGWAGFSEDGCKSHFQYFMERGIINRTNTNMHGNIKLETSFPSLITKEAIEHQFRMN